MIKRMFGVMAISAALALSTGCMNRGATSMAKNCTPTTDLELSADYSRDAIGQSELTGSLFNRSLDKDYENVQLQVEFYDQAGSRISSQVLVVDEEVDAGEAEQFSLAFVSPVGTDRASWSIMCAEPD